MSIDAARAFNQRCPPGTPVHVPLRNGSVLTGKRKTPAFLWSGIALVELEGLPGYWTVDALSYRTKGGMAESDPPQEDAAALADCVRSRGATASDTRVIASSECLPRIADPT